MNSTTELSFLDLNSSSIYDSIGTSSFPAYESETEYYACVTFNCTPTEFVEFVLGPQTLQLWKAILVSKYLFQILLKSEAG